jgi:hypothetical protein
MHADRPDVCASPEDYKTTAGYAIAMDALAADGQSEGQIGAESGYFDCEYAIEPEPGGLARREGIEFLADAIDTLPDYRAGAPNHRPKRHLQPLAVRERPKKSSTS